MVPRPWKWSRIVVSVVHMTMSPKHATAYTHNPSKKQFSGNNGEICIEKHNVKIKSIPQLGFSARLMCGNTEIVINNIGCHMLIDDNFVAKVKFDQPERLDRAKNFGHAEEMLLEHIRIVHVIHDKVNADMNKYQESFLNQFGLLIKQLVLDDRLTNMEIKFLRFNERIKQLGRLTYAELCDISKQFNSKDLQEQAEQLKKNEHKVSIRKQFFDRIKYNSWENSLNLFTRLKKLADDIFEHRRKILTMNAPANLIVSLHKLSQKHLMLINSRDVKQFTDLSSVLSTDVFETPLRDLTNRWINRVKSIDVDRLQKPLQLTCAILFFLCKSLEEVIVDITQHTDHRATDLLKSTGEGWIPITKIVWKSENAVTKRLQTEYEFIFRLVKHFEGESDFSRPPFQYETQFFNNGKSTLKKGRNIVEKAWDEVSHTFKGKKPNPFGVPDDFYVWYCILDDVLFNVLPNDFEHEMLDHVFDTYVKMIRDANYDQMETLRVVTRNLGSFITQSFSGSGWSTLNKLDMEILQKHLDIISSKNKQSVGSSNNFRDQVDVFNRFWTVKSEILDQLLKKINIPQMTLLQDTLKEILLIILNKDVDVDARLTLCRTKNDLLIDLNEVPFEWYIRDSTMQKKNFIYKNKVKLVDNKLKDTDNRIYQVLDPEIFSKFYKRDLPKHYIFEVLQALLKLIIIMLERPFWTKNVNLSDTDQVECTNQLIIAIKSSLIYLKEQVDYVSFDVFYDERVKPFDNVVHTATSRQDFSDRINLIKESFWYIRKQNEISFDDALKLYSELNSPRDISCKLLREAYTKYTKFFNEFMVLSNNEEYSEKASLIASQVKAAFTGTFHFHHWDGSFKQHQVPYILAGLGAVWSILVSKDVAKVGKYFNPHCIQILCVLRLLSVDTAERGIDKHLAEVLTGQGKSLVLGLLATLFSLTGHSVRIACYSKYLANRDQRDFLTFYTMFDVAEKITYGTFDDLANEIIKPTVGGRSFALRDLVNDLLFKEKTILQRRLVAANLGHNVLLMDEVDVFFTKEFYGNTYNPCITPFIPGLDRIQELIWKCVVTGPPDVENQVQQFIQKGDFEQRIEFLEFLERSNDYELFNDNKELKMYTNKTLFEDHVGIMVRDARNVINGNSLHKYKLDSSGVITYNSNGIYVTHTYNNYQNIFNYLRLKKENFVTMVNGNKNYGYLVVDCGSLSYAMLPMNYPLIVGVSGTLTSLNKYEKNTIKTVYNIEQTSVMPTFFGCSNLQFSKVENFHYHNTKNSWTTNIFRRANDMTKANRAVIIFFETDVELNGFEAEYAGQLDRLNVLTENTEDKEKLISEAGVAKTITLATRGMGRGVDYKSSVTVEKNGGVHVIQTFFSTDVKEETQIKGRTARKDNRGSYELIVCDENSESDYVGSYEDLDAKRSKSSLEENEQLSSKIANAMDVHEATMAYMGSFFQG